MDLTSILDWSYMVLTTYVFQVYTVVILIYIIALQGIYTYLSLVGAKKLNQYAKRYPLRDYKYVASSPFSIPISILAPAYNEEVTIVDSVRSLLGNRYSHVEVVVVNDGSTDGTIDMLVEAFDLQHVTRTPRSSIPTETVKAVYVSPLDPRLIVIDKANGGKADALNTGVNYARYPLVCSIDADTLVDPESLEKLVWEFQIHPDTIATGGTVRIVNGCKVEDGKVIDVGAPRRMLPAIQVAEYLRAFLGGRIGWSENNMLLIISGAFGLFRRQALVDIGGYDKTTVGEDAELVLRLYKHFLSNGLPFRASFFPDPVCWTEAPSTFNALAKQRDRWQRGLVEMMWRHRDMLFNREYGKLGFLALPYFWVFEVLGPIIEVTGYIIVPLAVAFGLMSLPLALMMAVLIFLYGVLLSVVSLVMEDSIPGRYRRWSDLGMLLLACIVENFGYRQWQAWVRCKAMITMRFKRNSWGEMKRTGFVSASGGKKSVAAG